MLTVKRDGLYTELIQVAEATVQWAKEPKNITNRRMNNDQWELYLLGVAHGICEFPSHFTSSPLVVSQNLITHSPGFPVIIYDNSEEMLGEFTIRSELTLDENGYYHNVTSNSEDIAIWNRILRFIDLLKHLKHYQLQVESTFK